MKQTEEKSNFRNITGIVAFIIMFVISFFTVWYFFIKPATLEKQMKEAANEVNEISPVMVDAYSRLDSASTVGDEIFKYHYTLPNMTKEEVNLDTVNKYIKTGIVENVRTSPELKAFRDNKVTLSYNYYDKNGEFVTRIEVTPDMY